MAIRSQLIGHFFQDAQYNPLLATWPSTDVDHKLLQQVPSAAQAILKMAYSEEAADGLTPGPEVWERWLDLFRREGASDATQVALAGLLFLQHECRHHIDTYCTSFGSTLVTQLYGEYGLLYALCKASSDSDRTHYFDRLRRSEPKRVHLLGGVWSFQPADWEGEPAYEHSLRGGTLRMRRSVQDPTDAIVTLSTPTGDERVLSLYSILEPRAFIETVTSMNMVLAATGASIQEQQEADVLLAEIGIDTTRDDYWGVLRWLSSRETPHDMVNALPEIAENVFGAGWFALHIDALGARQPEVEDNPLLRFSVALSLFERIRTPQGEPVREWTEKVFERIQQEVHGRELDPLLQDHLGAMRYLEAGFGIHPWAISGPASDHIRYLASVSVKALEKRLAVGPKWADEFAWPPNMDPRVTVPAIGPCPKHVQDAAEHLQRVRKLLQWPSPDMVRITSEAKELFI